MPKETPRFWHKTPEYKPPTVLTAEDRERLKTHLSTFYSRGQLELIYCTLTDKGPYPGMTDLERSARTEAIAEILGKNKPKPKKK